MRWALTATGGSLVCMSPTRAPAHICRLRRGQPGSATVGGCPPAESSDPSTRVTCPTSIGASCGGPRDLGWSRRPLDPRPARPRARPGAALPRNGLPRSRIASRARSIAILPARSRRAAFARTSTTGWASSSSRSRRCASERTTSPTWPNISCAFPRAPWTAAGYGW